MHIILRASTYYLRRRVPRRYQPVEERKTVEVSLHTDSENAAKAKAVVAWDNLIGAWEAKLRGDSSDAEARFEAARELAQRRGFQFAPAAKVAKLPTDELLRRIEAVPETGGEPDKLEAAAILGGAAEPPITVSRALELYWTLADDRTDGKSEDQMRRWKNPRIKAVKNFVAVIGDKAMKDISGDDMLDFREWWSEKIKAEDLTRNSANKDLIHLGDVLKTVNRMKRLNLVLPLTDLNFKESEKGQRPPFSEKWIREKILKAGVLDGLNGEARGILLGMVNTGYRPSEGAMLTADQIHLGGAVPYISIEPVDRQLKTAHARRVIPLTGVSLEAFRANPGGFPRYQKSNASLSATVNKFLRENGLLETPGHSMYSLRHAFEDRMIAAEFDDRIRRDLFGHRQDREKYGKGATLEHMHRLLQTIAL